MTEIACSGVLFDMDGVLIDSTPAVARVWSWWAREHGLNPEEVVSKAHGRPSITTVREYVGEADATMENLRIELAEMEDLEGVIPLPGARELLDSLPPQAWTIVTSCTRRLALIRIRAAGLPVPQRIVTATDVINGKPYPEPYLKGAALLGFPTQQCVVVEDAPAGVRAGKAAGASVLALMTTIPYAKDLQQSGADWVVTDCSAVAVNNGASESLGLILDEVRS